MSSTKKGNTMKNILTIMATTAAAILAMNGNTYGEDVKPTYSRQQSVEAPPPFDAGEVEEPVDKSPTAPPLPTTPMPPIVLPKATSAASKPRVPPRPAKPVALTASAAAKPSATSAGSAAAGSVAPSAQQDVKSSASSAVSTDAAAAPAQSAREIMRQRMAGHETYDKHRKLPAPKNTVNPITRKLDTTQDVSADMKAACKGDPVCFALAADVLKAFAQNMTLPGALTKFETDQKKKAHFLRGNDFNQYINEYEEGNINKEHNYDVLNRPKWKVQVKNLPQTSFTEDDIKSIGSKPKVKLEKLNIYRPYDIRWNPGNKQLSVDFTAGHSHSISIHVIASN